MNFVRAIVILIFLLSVSCSKRPDYVLPTNKMVNVLTDLHFADAAGTILNDHDIDSARIYGWVFRKNKISAAEFDSSLVYYSRHGDKLDVIYKRVIVNLTKKEEEIKSARKVESNVEEIYHDKNVYRLPFDGPIEKIPIDVPINEPGRYTISVRLKILQQDQSENPHLTAYFWYGDNTPEGQRQYFEKLSYEKNNKTTTYSVSLRIDDKRYSSIKGFILDHDNKNDNFIKQAEVYSIKVTRDKD